MRVGIVGAGITGLALSQHLRQRGVDSVAFEATDRPGGVIRSKRIDGTVVEWGPQRLRLTDSIRELVDDVGLNSSVRTAPDELPLYVYADEQLRQVPMTAKSFLTTDLLSWRGKLRLLTEPLTDSADSTETAAEVFTRKFGSEAYRNVIGPLYGGIYGSDPARMPANHALTRLMRLEEREGSLLKPALKRALSSDGRPPAATFENGMEQLPAALHAANEGRIRLETPVRAIRETGDRYVIDTDDGGEAFDRVVVTTEAPIAADLLSDVSPSASALAGLTYNPLAVVHVRVDCPMDGFGFQVRADEPVRMLGSSWNDSTFERERLQTCFYGGMTDPEIVSLDDEELASIVRDDYETIVGRTPEIVNIERLHRGFPAYDDSWDAMEELELPDDVHLATNYAGGMGVPSRVREATRLADRFASMTDADAASDRTKATDAA